MATHLHFHIRDTGLAYNQYPIIRTRRENVSWWCSYIKLINHQYHDLIRIVWYMPRIKKDGNIFEYKIKFDVICIYYLFSNIKLIIIEKYNCYDILARSFWVFYYYTSQNYRAMGRYNRFQCIVSVKNCIIRHNDKIPHEMFLIARNCCYWDGRI